MTRTPWGNSEKLRERRLPPGPATPAAAVEANQRERLFAALVACVDEKGYEATRVEDLVELSGVSRSAFYAHFSGMDACCLAAVEALFEPTVALLGERRQGRGEAGARAAFHGFLALLSEQAAAARLCFVEVYAAGPAAIEVLLGGVRAFEEAMAETLEQMPRTRGMPRQILRAMIGGLHKVISARLYRRQEAELGGLEEAMWRWRRSYEPPPGPLRGRRRRAPRGPSFEERQAASTAAGRILRAMAEVAAKRGVQEMHLAEVVECAQVSRRTFYEHFASKDEALLAAIDQGSSLMLAEMMPAFRRAPDWEHGVKAALEAMFAFAGVEPEYTRLGAVEIYAAGRPALEQRDRVMGGMEALLGPGLEANGKQGAITAELVGGAVYALIYDQVQGAGPASLAELVPVATYVALAPFLGARRAYEVACE